MLITVKQAAGMLACSRDKVRSLIRRGLLDAQLESDSKVGSPNYSGNLRWMIDRQSVERVMRTATEAVGGEDAIH